MSFVLAELTVIVPPCAPGAVAQAASKSAEWALQPLTLTTIVPPALVPTTSALAAIDGAAAVSSAPADSSISAPALLAPLAMKLPESEDPDWAIIVPPLTH